ncbi:MAG: hypothetical protein KAY65_07915 [Planctomycetes bacterium]|nr:hypothetical protein [Planctomycetota bacterium]
MKKALKGRLAGCTLVLVLVVLGTVIGGDVTIQEGTIEGEVFKSTGCTATGIKAIAFGDSTTASGDYSTAMGYNTTASGHWSTAMGWGGTAIGARSIATGNSYAGGSFATAMGGSIASADHSTALGYYCANSVPNSLAVGFGSRSTGHQVDFRVESEFVTVGDPNIYYGELVVGNNIDCNECIERSSFYDKNRYGRALDHLEDCSNTIKVNGEGKSEYDHERDPVFLKKWVSVKDYDKYTDEYVWDEELQEYEAVRTYETHQELRSSLSMKVAWLRQCVFELRQENATLKGELAAIKKHVGME